MCCAATRGRAARRRGSLLPDPRYDVVRCIALAAANDVEDVAGGRFTARALLYDLPGAPPSRLGLPDVQARRPRARPPHPGARRSPFLAQGGPAWHVLRCLAGRGGLMALGPRGTRPRA